MKQIDEYITKIEDESKRQAIQKLRQLINENIPNDFEETINYGMIGWVVPHSIYPSGYHCKPKDPLPFINLAAQKNFIALYHMAIYADENLLNWFVEEYKKSSKTKLDMGKSCIRFKKPENIPYSLIVELVKKITAKDWIALYESKFKNKS